MATEGIDAHERERRLRERLAQLQQRMAGLEAAPERGSGISFGKRIGDGTIEAVSRLTDIGVGRGMESEAEQIQRALAKLEEGTYGVCDGCGKPIPVKRLDARPESTLCVACAGAAPRA